MCSIQYILAWHIRSVFYVWIMYNIAGLEYIIERAHSLSLTVAVVAHTQYTERVILASFCLSRCLIVWVCVRTQCAYRVC